MLIVVPKVIYHEITGNEDGVTPTMVNINFNNLLDIEENDKGRAVLNYILGNNIELKVSFVDLFTVLNDTGLVDSTFLNKTASCSKFITEFINKK